MDYSSLHRVLFSSVSYPCLDVTSAVLLLSLFQSLNAGKRLQNRIVVLRKKALPAEGAPQGTERELSHPRRPVPPPHRPSDQTQLRGGRMQRARVTRSRGMPCSTPAPSFIGAAGSFNRVVTGEDVSTRQSQACCVHCSQYSVYR